MSSLSNLRKEDVIKYSLIKISSINCELNKRVSLKIFIALSRFDGNILKTIRSPFPSFSVCVYVLRENKRMEIDTFIFTTDKKHL